LNQRKGGQKKGNWVPPGKRVGDARVVVMVMDLPQKVGTANVVGKPPHRNKVGKKTGAGGRVKVCHPWGSLGKKSRK